MNVSKILENKEIFYNTLKFMIYFLWLKLQLEKQR